MSRRARSLPRGWYPADPEDCRKDIESYVEGWPVPSLPFTKGIGGIVPHAGWYFSGKLAARVFHTLRKKSSPEVIVLYGGHLGGNELPKVVMEESWETPLGEIAIHQDLSNRLMKELGLKKESPGSGDNTIEIQIAMVKYFFPASKVVALRSPPSLKAETLGREVAEISRNEGISILAVGSTDLTHYGPNYGSLRKGVGPSTVKWVKEENDKGFIDRALKMDVAGLLKHADENDSACSAGAAAAAIATCKGLGAEQGTLLDYYTSYDIMPDESFVGYAGIVY